MTGAVAFRKISL